ncbi:Hypoxia up-regulated protein 1 [Halotydeus destructor]|nr:Hypoxia up-regulated protein 1 [Halotydeus destructor]
MLLRQCKHYAELAAGDGIAIGEIVITVPPYFTQVERRSILRSAELAGLKVLQLLNSNSAVALNYGVFRIKDFQENSSTNIMFIDAGSTSTTASVVSYQIVKSKEPGLSTATKAPQLQIRGVGYDRTLGGFEMQLRLRDLLAKLFSEQRKIKLETVTSNKRAMAKLLKEAGRLKRVLSANSEHTAQVENVMDDKDLKAPVTRQEFEDLCADLLSDRLQTPVQTALHAAGMTAADLDQVILFGGNSRVPKVQEILSDALGGKELGKSVNSDEAAALGAAYQAARLGKGFKVKQFNIKDINLFPIQVDFWRDVEQEGESPKAKHTQRILFNRNNVIPQKKVLTFNKHTDDFDFFVNYGDMSGILSPAELSYIGSKNITHATISGVADAIARHNTEEEEYKGVKVHFKLDDSGILQLEQVEAVYEKKVEEVVEETDNEKLLGDTIAKLGNTFSKLFGSTPDEGAANETETNKNSGNATEETQSSNQTESEAESQQAVNSTEPKEVRKEIKIKTLKEPLKMDVKTTYVQNFNEELTKKSRTKLDEYDKIDAERFKRDSARNALESFIIETKTELAEGQYDLASEEEREKLLADLTAASEWLEYESDNATSDVLRKKLLSLVGSFSKLLDQINELKRKEAEKLAALEPDLANQATSNHTNWKDILPFWSQPKKVHKDL